MARRTKAGETIKLPELAHTLTRMVQAERAAARKGRAAGIVAARNRFYKGDIAREMVAFLKQHQAPFELDDFAEFFAKVEAPATTSYRGTRSTSTRSAAKARSCSKRSISWSSSISSR